MPNIHFAAIFATDIPMDFETKGIVLEALGFTSIHIFYYFLIAN